MNKEYEVQIPWIYVYLVEDSNGADLYLWPFNKAVLTCTHNICFVQKYENSQTISTENCRFYCREISQYIAWAC